MELDAQAMIREFQAVIGIIAARSAEYAAVISALQKKLADKEREIAELKKPNPTA